MAKQTESTEKKEKERTLEEAFLRLDEIIQKLEKGEEVEKIQYVDEAYFDTSMDLEEILKTRAY